MSTFEIYLLKKTEGALDGSSVLEVLLQDGHTQPLPSDPVRAMYQNPDTGVFFQMTLAPEIASLWRSRISRPGDEGEEEPSRAPADFLEEGSEEDREEGEGEEEAQFDIETVPAILNIPLICPSFFGREAILLAEKIARAADLHLEHSPSPGQSKSEPAPEGIPFTDFFEIWDQARRESVGILLAEKAGKLEVVFPGGHIQATNLTYWSERKASAWWSYGRARADLEGELRPEKIRIPALQIVYHKDEVKILCAWEVGTPTVFPRCDLVLLRRVRERKGLLRTKRTEEESLIKGDALWETLSRFGEYRKKPVEHLLVRDLQGSQDELLRQIDGLDRDPPGTARRTILLGVVDLEG